MKLLFLFGDGAVGKMTVGQELMKKTGLRLFHNHMTIEPVIEIFGHYDGRVTDRLRQVIFEEFAASEAYGMIFTFMWAFDQQADCDFVARISDIFRSHLPSWWLRWRFVWSAMRRKTACAISPPNAISPHRTRALFLTTSNTGSSAARVKSRMKTISVSITRTSPHRRQPRSFASGFGCKRSIPALCAAASTPGGVCLASIDIRPAPPAAAALHAPAAHRQPL